MTEADIHAALTDELALALTLEGEARGEPIEGRIAVASVIRNRARIGHFGGMSPKAVCLARAQFSCWFTYGGADNHAYVLRQAERALTHDPGGWDESLRENVWIASGVLEGLVRDRSKGADHYVTRTLFASPSRPSWIAAMVVTGVIGNHVFLRSGPQVPGVKA